MNARLRRSAEVRGLIEFSRAVHAEMHAILNAGHSSGTRVKGGKLYVAFVEQPPQPLARPGLRLVSSTAAAKGPKAHLASDDLTLIEARLIGRTKFF